jgi:magnesium transporter
MLTVYLSGPEGKVVAAEDARAALVSGAVVWVDLLEPTTEEERAVEEAFGVDAPTPLERAALEESARFYEENGALFLTATLLGRRAEGAFVAGPVTFVLTGPGPRRTLITVRSVRPRAFEIGKSRASARIEASMDGAAAFATLLEGVLERTADVLQENAHEAQHLSTRVFMPDAAPQLPVEVRTIGRLGALAAMAHDSLASLQRLASYAAHVCAPFGVDPTRMTALRHDAEQLERVCEAQQEQLTFLLDATLGLVGAAQNNSLKAISIATILFVPPTLIASVFGMNFEAMDWFKAPWGPAVAFGLMAFTSAGLVSVARWRRWF